jgi:adenine deaminase
MAHKTHFSGQLVDIFKREIYPVTLDIIDGKIAAIHKNPAAPQHYLLPGFVDAHIHIESSMLTPFEFARKALLHGTIATVSDPHEIANVCGMEGVFYMIENAADAKLKFHFGAPSCVPATPFETAGATLPASDIEILLKRDDISYLSEMMNYPGVLFNDAVVSEKIAIAKKYGKPIDGHAPGLTGADAVKYINAGISTDHECFTIEEASFKLKHGMKILIREGSAARNFEALHPLISSDPGKVMLCSDDKHPDELMDGHINLLVKRALANGHQLFDILQCACVNPVKHYSMNVGLLRLNDPADFIVVDSLKDFNVKQTWINGELVVDNGVCILEEKTVNIINNFNCNEKNVFDFKIKSTGEPFPVIKAIDGQLITESFFKELLEDNNEFTSDPLNDILKIAVVNRYHDEKPAIGFINGFGIKSGAIASTVAHDSHNIICVGTDDMSITKAVNILIKNRGGLCVVSGNDELVLPLPVAGLMSDGDCETVAGLYSTLDKKVKQMGSTLRAPFMTLSFMALLVIPELKLSDKGLFDGKKFELIK